MNAADIFVSTDVSLLDREWVRRQIKTAYWGDWRTDEIINTSLANSLCVGLYWRDPETGGANHPEKYTQLGFARVVGDGATFSWICDVLVDPDHRGKGYGKFLVSQVVALPSVDKTVCILATRDAHALYEKFGFERVGENKMMRRIPRN